MKKYKIRPENIVGHSDIAPNRKADPGKAFFWEELAKEGVGFWYDVSDAKEMSGYSVEQLLGIIGYDVKNIYNNLGYWNEEIYRLGVVYILSDNSLTPVFNIRGADGIPLMGSTEQTYTNVGNVEIDNKRNYITYDSDTLLITKES